MLNRAEVGRLGEEMAVGFLVKRGFKILFRNWKTPRWGEIDIVARDKEDLVFVEVKTRSNDYFGKPFEAVNYFKLKTLVRAAQFYREVSSQLPSALRIDVVSVVLSEPPLFEYFRSVYSES